jgi:hypothetical protein
MTMGLYVFLKINKVQKIGGYIKNWRMFQTFCHIQCLEIKASQRNSRSVEQDSIRF